MAAQPDLHPAHAAGAGLRGRRRGHDLQGPAARHRGAAAVHGLPLHRARPVARRVPARPLRRADGRRADGRGVRRGDVPRHRGPDVRRHRGRDQPAGAGAARSTGRRGCRPTGSRTARWTVVIDESHPPVSRVGGLCCAIAWLPGRRPRAGADRHCGRRGRRTTAGPLLSDLDFGAFSHSALVRIADEVCLQMHLLILASLAPWAASALDGRGGRGVRAQAADRDRRARRLPPARALDLPDGGRCPARSWRCTRCSTPRRTSSRVVRRVHRGRLALTGPRGRRLDLAVRPGPGGRRCRPSCGRSTRTSTSTVAGDRRPTGPAAWSAATARPRTPTRSPSPGSAPAPPSRSEPRRSLPITPV